MSKRMLMNKQNFQITNNGSNEESGRSLHDNLIQDRRQSTSVEGETFPSARSRKWPRSGRRNRQYTRRIVEKVY